MEGYHHQVTVRHDSRPIRFYLWLYSADVKKINICKLFWGSVFAIPALLLYLLAQPILFCLGVIGNAVDRRKSNKRSERNKLRQELGLDYYEFINYLEKEAEKKRERRKERRRVFSESTLENISTFFTRISMGLSFVLNRILGPVLPIIGILWGLTLIVAIALIVPWAVIGTWIADKWPTILATFGGTVIGLVLLALFIMGMIRLDEAPKDVKEKRKRVLAKPFVIFAQGIMAIKYRTCPTVKVE